MSRSIRLIAVFGLMSGLVAAAVAQQQQSASAPTASAGGTGPRYRSVFEGYRGYTEQSVQSWAEANGTVARNGGWQSYAREGQGGPVAGSAPEPATPSGHAGMQHGGAPGASGAAVAPAASTPGPSPAPVKTPSPSRSSSAPGAVESVPSGTHSGHHKSP